VYVSVHSLGTSTHRTCDRTVEAVGHRHSRVLCHR
jgi:hypothetical protein